MGLLDSIQTASRKAVINTEIAMTERNIKNRQRAFGVEFYDLVMKHRAFLNTVNDKEFIEAFEHTEAEVKLLVDRRDAKQQELDVVTANKDRNAFKQTALERTGQWLSDSGAEAKLGAEICLLDRSINQQKEALGLVIYEKISGGKLGGVLNSLTKLSSGGRDLEKCIQDAKKDIEAYQSMKDRKMRELYNVK